MRKFFVLSMILLAVMLTGTIMGHSQTDDKQSFTINGVYLRKDNKLELPNGNDLKFNPQKDSGGFEVAYDYAPAKYVSIGIQGGATFHDQAVSGTTPCGVDCTVTKVGDSKVALAWADYYVQLQRRKGFVQPLLKGTIGAARSDFGGITAGSAGFVSTSANMFTYGGEFGVDWRIKSNNKVFLRTSVAAKQLIGGDTRQFDVYFKFGPSFRF